MTHTMRAAILAAVVAFLWPGLALGQLVVQGVRDGATAANQSTAITHLSTIANNVVDAGAPINPGSATATQSLVAGCQYTAAGVTFADGQQGSVQCTANGGLYVAGNAASGAADAGNPVKVGGRYNSTKPTLDDGDRGDVQLTSTGMVGISIYGADSSNGASVVAGTSDTVSASGAANLQVINKNLAYDGTDWGRMRTIVGNGGAGVGVLAMAPAAHSISAGAITPSVTSAAASNLVIKASAGNLYSLVTTTGAVGGYVMTFNATSAPADGAVTPVECVVISSYSTVGIDFGNGPPDRYSTGITAVFSSTGCFTKTASATAFFKARYQ